MVEKTSSWNHIPLLALTSALFITGADVYAQSEKETAEVLEEIVVTALRRTDSLQNTAISASVLSGDMIEDKGVTDLVSLQYAAPGMTVSDFGSANVFNLRGIGRSQVDIDVPSGVVIYRDGTPTLAGYFQNEPYFDIDSIEVLRGPQGTFVGKTAAGGAVFINTNDAELEDFYGSVEVGLGSYDAKEFTGIANIPLSDTLALRLAFRHYDRNDFYDSISADFGEPFGAAFEDPDGGGFTGDPGEVDNYSYRAGLLWQPNNNLTAIFKLDYHDLDFGGNPTTSFGEEPLGDIAQDADFDYSDESVRAVLNIKYELDNGITLSSLTGYQQVDSVNNLDLNATDPLFFEFKSAIDAEVYSQEINVISAEDQRLRWVLGFFWQKQDARLLDVEDDGFVFSGGGFTPDFPWAGTPWDNVEEEWAVFGHLQFDLTEQLELEAGLRYTDYERNQATVWGFSFGLAPPIQGTPGVIPFPGASVGGDEQSLSEDSVDGQVALNWTVNNHHFLYALISRGHITGGVNIFPPFLEYDEMEVINAEGGWKASLFEDQLRVQFSVYYEIINDYQANFADAVGFGNINAPTNRTADDQSELWGVEMNGQARFDRLSVDFGWAYLDTELGTFSNVVDPFRVAPDNVVDLSGAHSPFSPKWTGNVGVAYDFPFLGDMTLTPRVDVAHRSETQAALWDSPLVTLESRTLVNTQLTLVPSSAKWSATFWMTNAGNKHYIGGIQNNATLHYAGAPREFGFRLKYNF